MKKSLLAIAITTAAAAASADYQMEAGIFYGEGEFGDQNAVDYDVMGVQGRYNFESVDTSKGPHAEAAFLDKSSSVGFIYATLEEDRKGADDVDTFGFDVRVVTNTNLILEGAYSQADSGDEDTDVFSLGIGTYLNANTEIVATYENTDDDTDEVDQLTVALHGVNPLAQGASLGYDAALAYIDTDDQDGYMVAVGATYYFNNSLGVNLSADVTELDDFNSDTLTLAVSYFPQPNVELTAGYFDQGGDEDADGVMIGADLRF